MSLSHILSEVFLLANAKWIEDEMIIQGRETQLETLRVKSVKSSFMCCVFGRLNFDKRYM